MLRLLSAAVVGVLIFVGASSQATIIVYSANDLVDTTPGEDLWQYSYQVSGLVQTAGHGFTIFFDPADYTALQATPPQVSPDWDVLSIQPDVILPADGFLDALALVDSPDNGVFFTIEFVWQRSGSPGSQLFDIYDPSFATIESGTTVPEPNLAFLLVAALWTTVLARQVFHERIKL